MSSSAYDVADATYAAALSTLTPDDQLRLARELLNSVQDATPPPPPDTKEGEAAVVAADVSPPPAAAVGEEKQAKGAEEKRDGAAGTGLSRSEAELNRLGKEVWNAAQAGGLDGLRAVERQGGSLEWRNGGG